MIMGCVAGGMETVGNREKTDETILVSSVFVVSGLPGCQNNRRLSVMSAAGAMGGVIIVIGRTGRRR